MDLVTNPEAHSAPEAILLLPDGSCDVLANSNEKDTREPLMSDAQESQLRGQLTVILDRLAVLYRPAPSEPFALEVKFKIASANKLAIKQARPWVRPQRLNQAPTVAEPLADVRQEGPEQRAISLSGAFNDPDGGNLAMTAV